MGTAQAICVEERCGGATVNHVTGRGHVWKYVLCMHNRKLRNIHPSEAFWQEMTSSNVTRSVVRILLSFSSPFTGFLPLSRHFIFIITLFISIITFLTKVCHRHHHHLHHHLSKSSASYYHFLALSLVIFPLFYFHNYIIYFNNRFHLRCFRICCVVLQGCPRSHCEMNEMVNLIPTCIVSNKTLFQDDSSQFWKTMYIGRRRRRWWSLCV